MFIVKTIKLMQLTSMNIKIGPMSSCGTSNIQLFKMYEIQEIWNY